MILQKKCVISTSPVRPGVTRTRRAAELCVPPPRGPWAATACLPGAARQTRDSPVPRALPRCRLAQLQRMHTRTREPMHEHAQGALAAWHAPPVGTCAVICTASPRSRPCTSPWRNSNAPSADWFRGES